MSGLRILHVTPYYEDAWAYGGIPRLATTLARGLARRGHRVTVATTDACDAVSRLGGPGARPARGAGPAVRSAGGVEVRVFPNASNRLAYRWQLFVPLGLAAWLREHAGAYDVAHLHGFHHLPGATAGRHLRRAGVPYVLAPNGTAPRIERRRIAKLLFDVTVGRGVLPGASRVLAVSEAERGQLARLGVSPAVLRVVPNPVDLSEFDEALPAGELRRRLGLGGAPLVLYLGTLTPRKRVDILVRAFAALGRPEARLVIAGNDLGSGPAIRRLVDRLGLGPRTVFTGLLRGRDRLLALTDADVVVYPSRDEVFGLVPLEALLCGTPVIVADDSGAGEIVRRVGGGDVVRQGDPDAVARAIGATLGAPGGRRGAAREAGVLVRRFYGDDQVCARIEDLYREMLPSRAA